MKAYFVKSTDSESLQAALGRMIEYAKFMAEESGSTDRIGYIDTILEECDIDVEEIDQ